MMRYKKYKIHLIMLKFKKMLKQRQILFDLLSSVI